MNINILREQVLTNIILDRLMPGKLYKTQPPVLSFIYDATGCSLLARQRCCSFRRDPFLLTCPPPSQQFGYIIPATPEFFACRHPSNYNKSSRRKYQKLNPPETMLKVLIKVLPIGMGLKFFTLFYWGWVEREFFQDAKMQGSVSCKQTVFNACAVKWFWKPREWYWIESIKFRLLIV